MERHIADLMLVYVHLQAFPEDGADADPYAFPEDEPPADPYSSPEDAPSENAENGADAWDYDDTSYEEDDTVRYDGESN